MHVHVRVGAGSLSTQAMSVQAVWAHKLHGEGFPSLWLVYSDCLQPRCTENQMDLQAYATDCTTCNTSLLPVEHRPLFDLKQCCNGTEPALICLICLFDFLSSLSIVFALSSFVQFVFYHIWSICNISPESFSIKCLY